MPSLSPRKERAIFSEARIGYASGISIRLSSDPSLALAKDRHDRTPLQLAAEYGRAEAIEALLPYSTISADLLTRAILSNVPECVRLLLPHCDVASVDARGYTPLHTAVFGGRTAMVAMLLPMSDPLARSPSSHSERLGATALHLAARGAHPDCVALLANADAARLNDERLRTPLMLAAAHGDARSVQCLLSMSDPRAQDENRKSALHLAAESPLRRLEQKHSDAAACLRALLPHSDPLAKDQYGWTALHYAVQQGDFARIQVLADGPTARIATPGGETPLMLACARGDAKAAALLIPLSDLRARSSAGGQSKTALEWAEQFNRRDSELRDKRPNPLHLDFWEALDQELALAQVSLSSEQTEQILQQVPTDQGAKIVADLERRSLAEKLGRSESFSCSAPLSPQSTGPQPPMRDPRRRIRL